MDEELDPTEALDKQEDDEFDGITVKGPDGENEEEETPIDPEEVF